MRAAAKRCSGVSASSAADAMGWCEAVTSSTEQISQRRAGWRFVESGVTPLAQERIMGSK